MWDCDKMLAKGFRDVWEYGAEELEIQTIKFLKKEEARKIKDFTLYVYEYTASAVSKYINKIEKFDRTLDKRFNFKLPDGSDYRLIERKELFK